MRQKMENMVRQQQQAICAAVAGLDGHSFKVDTWKREVDGPHGGGGTTCVLQDGKIFEKAGVGVSIVTGTLSAEAARSMGGGSELRPDDPSSLKFFAAGLSLVLHPHNPMAPTVHANYRYFERGEPEAPAAWWFGGGADLTPAYLFEEDARHFHAVHREACERHDAQFYPRFKAWCDRYFYLPHRGETRGVGGIFFDDLHDRPRDALFAFVSDCAAALVPAYLPVVERRHALPFTAAHKQWQQLRRGRYVEFNLVYDRGTLFGLRTAGRIESILMSLPLTARWEYMRAPAPNSPEAALNAVLHAPKNWL